MIYCTLYFHTDAMNTQKHSAINVPPYEVVFGQPAGSDVFPGCTEIERDGNDVLKALEDTSVTGGKTILYIFWSYFSVSIVN